MSSSQYIVLMNANSIHELGLVRSILEANDIITFVQDEYSSQVMPYNASVNGVKLLISADDIEKSKDILLENNLLENTNLKHYLPDEKSSENLLTEWSVLGNYPPVKKFIFVIVIIVLILLIIYSL